MDLLFALALVVVAETCPDPADPCAGFREHDLSFSRESGGMARAEERSAPFFAVIVLSGKACEIAEKERLRIQKLFPKRKVFSSQRTAHFLLAWIIFSRLSQQRPQP